MSIEGGDDVFVHHTSIESEGFRKLQEGDKVDFGIVQGEKGNILSFEK
ncbi:MAG: cold shock domain-containing protein [Candidatus Scalindua sp.]|nr:cold shock domain-containing protein [Candidatus Scalindua sp.]MBT5303599.1 cold shock domain-containing protein [Candidatus Scalindua sp.]MBT6046730.1 cold shock domain-containing protein [Candidatus Scalindua sp.]MBT6227958.1 cold shock domain-containing protein [Candidatus Scalindua sp.]MBT6564245.1 cold shock domain-containing protein [Candidatus Scalindua sp.]